jgi:hypothetical protein
LKSPWSLSSVDLQGLSHSAALLIAFELSSSGRLGHLQPLGFEFSASVQLLYQFGVQSVEVLSLARQM